MFHKFKVLETTIEFWLSCDVCGVESEKVPASDDPCIWWPKWTETKLPNGQFFTRCPKCSDTAEWLKIKMQWPMAENNCFDVNFNRMSCAASIAPIDTEISPTFVVQPR